ncbi:hypothetical protein ACXO6D_08935 [Lactobacillus delbrueckii subsp. bulgaricus]
MKEVKRIMVAAAVAVMALTAAGCSSSSSSSSSKSSSKVYKIGICQLVQHEAWDAATKSIPILGTAVTNYQVALNLKKFNGTVGGNISGTSDLAPLDKQEKR